MAEGSDTFTKISLQNKKRFKLALHTNISFFFIKKTFPFQTDEEIAPCKVP
jgi:hypothetical protein